MNVLKMFLLTALTVAAVSAQSLVFPPYLHSYGIRKAGAAQLFMFFGPRTFFDNPQGIAAAKMVSRDNPEIENDDDEVVVYGVNCARNHIIYNTSMWTLAMYGSRGSGKDQFLQPEGIACDIKGNVYIADRGNNRIVHLFNPKKEVKWAGAFCGNDGVILNSPARVALDEDGMIYVTDAEKRIVVFESSGIVKKVLPGPGSNFSFKDAPLALAIADGRNRWSYFRGEKYVFCADSLGRRIWKLGFDGNVRASIVLPHGHSASYAAVDYYHNLWLTDTKNSCILKYDHNLALLDIFGSHGKGDNQFDGPAGIAIWKRFGQVFVAEKTGAQYYWIGAGLKKPAVIKVEKDNGAHTLRTVLSEYSYLSVFHPDGADTIFYMNKRFSYPGNRDIRFTCQSLPARALFLRVEPTYSSYTYFHSDNPVTLLR